MTSRALCFAAALSNKKVECNYSALPNNYLKRVKTLFGTFEMVELLFLQELPIPPVLTILSGQWAVPLVMVKMRVPQSGTAMIVLLAMLKMESTAKERNERNNNQTPIFTKTSGTAYITALLL